VSGAAAATARDLRGEAAEEGGGGAPKHLDADAGGDREAGGVRADWAGAVGEGDRKKKAGCGFARPSERSSWPGPERIAYGCLNIHTLLIKA
jgi:hypothetical protein